MCTDSGGSQLPLPTSTHPRPHIIKAHNTQGPQVWLSRLVLILLVIATATHRTGGLARDNTAEGCEATGRLLSPARGSKPCFPATLGATHTGPDPPHPTTGPPSPATSVPPCLSPLPLAWPLPGGLCCSGRCEAPLHAPVRSAWGQRRGPPAGMPGAWGGAPQDRDAAGDPGVQHGAGA